MAHGVSRCIQCQQLNGFTHLYYITGFKTDIHTINTATGIFMGQDFCAGSIDYGLITASMIKMLVGI